MHVKKVDYGNQSSLVEALRGQDVLIITMGVMAPPDAEGKLIEAAAEANVPWILPNEWGGDMLNESLSTESLVGPPKKVSRDHITKLGKSSWIGIATGFWYEWSLPIESGFGFDFDNRSLTLFDDGERPICISTWPQVGRAVASLLSLPILPDGKGGASLDKYRNDFVYMASFVVSQKDMFESVLRVTKASQDDWKIVKEPVKERYAKGLETLKSGDRSGFVRALYSRLFFPDDSGNPAKTKGLVNDALGLPKEDIDEYTKIGISRVEESKKMFG